MANLKDSAKKPPGKLHGNKISIDWRLKKYILASTGEIINNDYSNLLCQNCGKPPTPEGYDACIGHLKGVKYACCGHGKKIRKYIMLDDGTCLYGDKVDFNLYK